MKLLKDIENKWEKVATSSLESLFRSESVRDYFAAGFWLFYVDYTEILPPYLSVAYESDNLDPNYRWEPPEWPIGLDEATNAMSEEYSELSSFLNGKSHADWDGVIEEHYVAISRVTKKLTAKFRGTEYPTVDRFIAGIFESRDGEEEYARLVKMSVDTDNRGVESLLKARLLDASAQITKAQQGSVGDA